MYMQYFLGFKSFSKEPPFDPSLFVEFRKRFGIDQANAINKKLLKGRVIMDVIACPQDIAHPTNLMALT